MIRWSLPAVLLGLAAAAPCLAEENVASPRPADGFERPHFARFVETHCLDCHDRTTKTADLALDRFLSDEVGVHPEVWEKVARKLAAGQMPPPEMPQPDEHSYAAALSWLERSLDGAAAAQPNPGRPETFRRLNRTEYQNAIRDLLALEIDAAALLPADESSHGFDNITVADLSPTLLNRYISAAQ